MKTIRVDSFGHELTHSEGKNLYRGYFKTWVNPFFYELECWANSNKEAEEALRQAGKLGILAEVKQVSMDMMED